MHREIEHQRRVMDASGLGLLPGMGLALAVAVVLIMGLLAEAWWATAGIFAAVLLTTGAVVWVVLKVLDDAR